jgi:PKD repeat protein
MSTVTFTVTDAAGHTATAQVSVTVQQPAIVANLILTPTTIAAGGSVHVTVSGSGFDTWQVTAYGDGNAGSVHTGTSSFADHVYINAGTYTVTAVFTRTSDGVTVTRTGTVTATAPTGTLGKLYGGISTPLGQSPSTADMDAMVAHGFGWWRHDFRMADISPSRGTFNWGTVDTWVTQAISRGLNYLPIVYMLPQWMNGSTDDKHAPTNPQDYADWCGTAATHLWGLGVRAMELWNEQNLGGFYTPAPNRTAYTQMAKLAAKAIHTATPGMTVVSGGVSTSDDQYNNSAAPSGNPWPGCNQTLYEYGRLGLYYDADGLSQVDAVGIHPYLDDTDPSPTGGSNWCEWAGIAMRNTIGIVDGWSHGRQLKVWNTESACPLLTSSGGTHTEADKATRATHAFQAFNTWTMADGSKMRNRLGPYFWFTYHDWSNATEVRARNFGLVDPSYNAHPALGAVTPILQGALT